MPTNPNMVAIQTVTVGSGGAASIDFTSIPQTYTDLVVRLSGRSTTADADMYISFNSNTANYSRRVLRGNGSAASSTSGSDRYVGTIDSSGETASTFGNWEIYVPNYTTSNNKSYSIDSVEENNATQAFQYMIAGLWSNSAAITSIKLEFIAAGTFAQYSTATLYGVTSAAYGAKATGGIITSDANYYYHTFLASDTFTPTSNITADYLVVAGGGGGGSSSGGGGGAGGLRCTVGATGGGGSLESALSLTASTNYTVTVGAGGAGGPSSQRGSNGSNSVFSSITATAGGGGGGTSAGQTGGNTGGSGGGGGGGVNGGAGTTNQGYAGGNVGGGDSAGGGGGAGAVGGNGAGDGSSSGNGGAGITTSVSGISTTYAGGGGGGGLSGTTRGTGGTGGGGAGASSTAGGIAGTTNTGGGGGGGWWSGSAASAGGAGGSGIVIVRYAK